MLLGHLQGGTRVVYRAGLWDKHLTGGHVMGERNLSVQALLKGKDRIFLCKSPGYDSFRMQNNSKFFLLVRECFERVI